MSEKGKNFSCNNSSGKRKKSDFYETPYSLTELLLTKIPINGTVLEPACGNGAIVSVLKKHGIVPTYYDKDFNFFNETRFYDWIITNPPYSLASSFIMKAKEHSDNFAFLLPLSYLHGKARYDTIYMDNSFRLKNVLVFTRYPLLGEKLRNDGMHNTGMMVYAWYVWRRGYTGLPEIDWLDNDIFIIRKGNKEEEDD